eukprot:NODE_854_length_1410_cov_89.419544_g709_i0.p1 GENE.NODE_854_length_1410_cov_89.419544_g709_i0~~NODE_854_length_1410_cov_89.419544_g709_i0.p1  ORF type:complete len:187 (-),score=48.39 NODE_854_length_1410_cov_89.419544_g709_i0:47-607(-)
MDCCHSGSVMDLPFTFTATQANMSRVFPNGKFKPEALPSMIMSQKWDLMNKKKLQKQVLNFGMQLAKDYMKGRKDGQGQGQSGSGFDQGGRSGAMADIIMFSGCKDSQTSADVGNVGTFNLPSGAGPGGAGGACTNAMVSAMSQNPHLTFIALLEEMRKILERKRFSQVPQLSSSKELNLGQPFSL